MPLAKKIHTRAVALPAPKPKPVLNLNPHKEGESASKQLDLRKIQHEKRKEQKNVTINEPDGTSRPPPEERHKRHKMSFMEKVREFLTQADMFASAHSVPIHVMCIVIAAVIIPISGISIIWDLMATMIFQIPDLSTINTPAFVLFINFIAMPLAMYGYMMEYLMHEHSQLAVIGLICVVVHPMLFLVRAFIEYMYDGFRGETKIYFEAFTNAGPEAVYPIGIIRYKLGDPYSDAAAGVKIISYIFAEHDHGDHE